jgi:hypothetical protein
MIHLKDLPEKKVYLRFNEKFKKEFFEVFENNFDISILENLGYKTVNEQWRAYKQLGAYYPLFLIKRLCQTLEKINSKFSIDAIEKYVIAIKSGGRGGLIFNPRFPFRFNDSIFRLIAHCLGDGDIHPSGRIRYTNSNKNLINSFISDLEVFGNVKIRRWYDSGAYRVYVPKIVKLILDEFGLKNRTHDFILKKNIGSQATFIQALFDDEGSVDLNSHRISISSSNKSLLKIIQESLQNFNIISRLHHGGYYHDRKGDLMEKWYIDITGFKNFKKFYKFIGSKHSEKSIKLKKLIKFYIGKKIRPIRYETSNKILNLLNEKPMSKQEISNRLKLPLNTISSQIFKLHKNGKVFPVGRKKISRQNAILWSLENKNVKWIKQNRYEEFSKLILNEADKPVTAIKLAKKFNRTPNNIKYFLKKMEKDNLVKRIRRYRMPHLWLLTFREFEKYRICI